MEKLLDDYILDIPNLEKELVKSKKAYDFFNTLTLGYKKRWAMYVYSAQKEETVSKRIERTISELEEGKKVKCCFNFGRQYSSKE